MRLSHVAVSNTSETQLIFATETVYPVLANDGGMLERILGSGAQDWDKLGCHGSERPRSWYLNGSLYVVVFSTPQIGEVVIFPFGCPNISP